MLDVAADRARWQFLNSFAAWFSAAASFTASGVALYLARRREWVRLRLRCGTGASLYDQFRAPGEPTAVFVEVVNHGLESVQVDGVLWQHRLLHKRSLIKVSDLDQSTKLPVKLARGDVATFYWKVSEFVDSSSDVVKYLRARRFPRLSARLLRIGLSTTTGGMAFAKPDPEMLRAMLAVVKPTSSARGDHTVQTP